MENMWGLVLIGILAVGGTAAISFVFLNQPAPVHSSGTWQFTVSGCWAFCSHYQLAYHFADVSNASTISTYNFTFHVIDLQGTTQGILLHRINVTMTNSTQAWVYSNSITPDVTLSGGQNWGPTYQNFSFTDQQLGLGPGQKTSLKISLSVEFDEVAVLTGVHYGKTERTSGIETMIQSSRPPPPSPPSLFALSWTSALPFIFLGSIAWAFLGFYSRVVALPRSTPWGFRDSETGQFMGSGKAWLAILAFIGSTIVFLVAMAGFPEHIQSYVDLFFGTLTGSPSITASLSVLDYAGGSLLMFAKQH